VEGELRDGGDVPIAPVLTHKHQPGRIQVSENTLLLGSSLNRDNLVYLELIVLFFTLFFLFLLARLLVLLLFVLLFSATRDGSEH
jgi:hypothetical protein